MEQTRDAVNFLSARHFLPRLVRRIEHQFDHSLPPELRQQLEVSPEVYHSSCGPASTSGGSCQRLKALTDAQLYLTRSTTTSDFYEPLNRL